MLGEIIAILAVLTFVVSNVIFRKTEHEATPAFINFFRTTVGTITFILIALLMGVFHYIFTLHWGLWILLCLSFLFGQVIGDTAYFKAQRELGTTIALAVSMTFPLFTFILSSIFLNRPFELPMILSLVFIAVGIIIIGNSKIKSEQNCNQLTEHNQKSLKTKIRRLFSYNSFKAIGYGLIASLGWAIGIIILDYSINQIDQVLGIYGASSIVGNVIRFPFALIILAVMVLRERVIRTVSFRVDLIWKSTITEIENIKRGKNNFDILMEQESSSSEVRTLSKKRSRKTWLLLLIGSIIGTSIGAYFYAEAAHIAGANVMALLASASPLFALPLTYWVNKEKISKQGFIGVILTIIGVIIILL